MPRYRSHKIVRAAPFIEAERSSAGWAVQIEVDGERKTIVAPHDAFARAKPSTGDYIVIYDDGYVSWSPKAAFESGYAAIEDRTHVFAGPTDARQSADTALPVSRFRPQYRALKPEEKALHDAIKAKAVELEALFEQVPNGRYKALSMTALEEAVMWNVKQLTS